MHPTEDNLREAFVLKKTMSFLKKKSCKIVN